MFFFLELSQVTFSSSEPFPNMGPVAPSSGTPREGPPGCPGCPPGGAGAKGLDPTGAATPGLALFLGWHHRCPTKKRVKLPSQIFQKSGGLQYLMQVCLQVCGVKANMEFYTLQLSKEEVSRCFWHTHSSALAKAETFNIFQVAVLQNIIQKGTGIEMSDF